MPSQPQWSLACRFRYSWKCRRSRGLAVYAGQGSFYRSQHELVGIFRVGKEAHLNNVELGRHGRSRSNVWHYAGINTFRAGRLDELKFHPTVKPVALVADAVRDCTGRGDIVLDLFGGSGTTILAAERVGPIPSSSNPASSMSPSSAGKPFPERMRFAPRPA
jgi:DNA modification methylase